MPPEHIHNSEHPQITPEPSDTQPAYVFSGIGCQWISMGADLLHNEPVFHNAVQTCDAALLPLLGWSVIEEMTRPGDESRLKESAFAHPCIFALQVGLVNLLRSEGISPSAVCGHSGGEVAAAYAAGILSLQDAALLVFQHVELIRVLVGRGTMAHISLPWDDIRAMPGFDEEQVTVAAFNGPEATVLTGNADSITLLVNHALHQNVFARVLHIEVPFHSPVINDCLAAFSEGIAPLSPNCITSVPIYSACTGTITDAATYDTGYWARHIRQPVRFVQAIESMLKDGYTRFLEIGPHPVLSEHIINTAEHVRVNAHILPTLQKDISGLEAFSTCLLSLSSDVGMFSESCRLRPDDNKSLPRPLVQAAHQALAASHAVRQRLLESMIDLAIEHTSGGMIQPDPERTAGFMDSGMTSLMAVQLRKTLSSVLGIKLPATIMFDYPDRHRLAAFLTKELAPGIAEHLAEETNSPILSREPLAVIGMGCRFPGGANNPMKFWRLLKDGIDTVTEVPRDRFDPDVYYDPDPDALGKTISKWGGFLKDVDIKGFDTAYFHINPTEAKGLDPQQRLLLEVCIEAVEDANIPVEKLRGTRVGVYIGISTDDYKQTALVSNNLAKIDTFSASGSMYSAAGGRISFTLGIHGPNISIDTACSSSLAALHSACQALRTGECEMALVAGVNLLLTPNLYVYFTKLGALSPDGRSRAFSQAANGYVRGEGCGVVMLERVSDAVANKRRIYATVKGTALNHDGQSSSFTAPNGTAQQDVIRQALKSSGLSPLDISYIEGHGTGTPLGDPVEVGALVAVYGKDRSKDKPLKIGSVKTNIGHLEAGAGVASLIKTSLALYHGALPASLHCDTPNELVPWDDIPVRVNTTLTPWTSGLSPRHIGISSFGFSGTNAHIIMGDAPRPVRREAFAISRPHHILCLSAPGMDALKMMAGRYLGLLNKTEAPLNDICYTATTGRSTFPRRVAFVGSTREEMTDAVSSWIDGRKSDKVVIEGDEALSDNRIAMLFTGQGSQYAGMGKTLYDTEPVFQAALDECNAALMPLLGDSLLAIMHGTNDLAVQQTCIAQPAIFSLQYALLKLWDSWGITPSIVCGHSVGEFAASVAAGVMNLADAARLIHARGHLMQELDEHGSMLVVFASVEQVSALIRPYSEVVSLAGINAPGSVVIAGRKGALAEISANLKSKKIETLPLNVSHAFHSPLMTPMLEAFEEVAGTISYVKPALDGVSTLTGKAFTNGDLTTTAYWSAQIRGTVFFSDATAALSKLGVQRFIELGGNPILTGLIRQNLPDTPHVATGALKKGEDDNLLITKAVATLFVTGTPVAWDRYYKGTGAVHTDVPFYPFARKEMWREPDIMTGISSNEGTHPLLGKRNSSPLAKGAVFFTAHYTKEYPYFLKDHIVLGETISPAAAHISLLIDAARQEIGDYPIKLSDLGFSAPLVVSQDQPRDTQIILENIAAKVCPISINSTSVDHDDWVLHATGFMEKLYDSPPAALNIEALRKKCFLTEDSNKIYGPMLAAGYALGPSFRRISEIFSGTEEGICTIDAPAGETYPFIAPGTMDSILQTSLSALFQPLGEKLSTLFADGGVVIPVGVSEIQVYRRPQGHFICHARNPKTLEKDRYQADITVLNEAGKILMLITGLTLQKTNKETLYQQVRATKKDMVTTLSEQEIKLSPAAFEETHLIIYSDNLNAAQPLRAHAAEMGLACTILQPVSDQNHLVTMISELIERSDRKRYIACIMADCNENQAEAGHISTMHAINFTQAAIRMGTSIKLCFLVDSTPASSPFIGLGSVISMEQPELKGITIRASQECPPDKQVSALLDTTGEQNLIIRNEAVYASRIKRTQLPKATFAFKPDTACLITGGLGALGLLTAQALAESGATDIILLSRRAPDAAALKTIGRIEATGARVTVHPCDISNLNQLKQTLKQLEQVCPIRTIFHAAGALSDGMLGDVTPQDLKTVFTPKANGAWNLHIVTKEMDLDHFVLFSSAAGILGNQGQSAYAAANAFLDGLAAFRHEKGLPALSVNWGPWDAGGMATSSQTVKDHLAKQGFIPLHPETAFETLADLMESDLQQAMANDCDWQRYASYRLGFGSAMWLEHVAHIDTSGSVDENIAQTLGVLEPEQRQAGMERFVETVALEVIGLGTDDRLNRTAPLNEQGFNSLMAVELRNKLKAALGINLSVGFLFNHPSISNMSSFLLETLGLDTSADSINEEVAKEGEFDYLDDINNEELERMIDNDLASYE